MTPPLVFSPEVAEALASRAPLVALESTIITHGMPFPQNVETARAVEAEVRAGGAVPATIAVRGGAVRVGLTADELDALARDGDVRKLSRADLAVALAEGWTGATTVAGGPFIGWICQHWTPRTALGVAGFATLGAATILALPRRARVGEETLAVDRSTMI